MISNQVEPLGCFYVDSKFVDDNYGHMIDVLTELGFVPHRVERDFQAMAYYYEGISWQFQEIDKTLEKKVPQYNIELTLGMAGNRELCNMVSVERRRGNDEAFGQLITGLLTKGAKKLIESMTMTEIEQCEQIERSLKTLLLVSGGKMEVRWLDGNHIQHVFYEGATAPTVRHMNQHDKVMALAYG